MTFTAPTPASLSSTEPEALLFADRVWDWHGFKIGYQHQGDQGAAIVLVHGFGASSGHWRKNIPTWARSFRVFAIDLIGFGTSHKPTPGIGIDYTFETWGSLLADFCRDIIGEPAFFVANSIGCIAAMQTAVISPKLVRGIVQLNCSLRLLHDRRRDRQNPLKRYGTSFVQNLLAIPAIGEFFFSRVATAKTVRAALSQAYIRKTAITNDLIEMLLAPSRSPRAWEVFVAFTRYSQGPLPEDLLPLLSCRTLLVWGDRDPWEPVALARQLAEFSSVDDFVELPGVGHCPQDEAPEMVNPIVEQWILKQCTLAISS
ncbi:MAG: alpha/beta fold hydrolase [Coleofasciculaceae cyanobacterium RL_1_1]|nr:alpha/beta fold hydrolase [Coleofasciculaceae cyanobacterium RL_1_1]